ncbi:hypothetical protein BY996DRAFT_6413836 [Phakopsora pachyrhizi]|nr:hypothetical protein BY996DRAFT_6413836 [Phakopsora pachyrhizi]
MYCLHAEINNCRVGGITSKNGWQYHSDPNTKLWMMRPYLNFRETKHPTLSIARVSVILTLSELWRYCWTSYKATTDRSRTTANIDKTGKLLAWQDVCDLQNKDESLDLIGSHWDMVDKLPLVMTNPMIKPMSSIISDAIMANSSLDLKPLMLNIPQRPSNQCILYNNTATATATPFSNINNYSLMTTDGTDSPRGGAESNIRSGLRRTGAIHRPEKTLQRSEEGDKNYITRGVEFFNLYIKKIL